MQSDQRTSSHQTTSSNSDPKIQPPSRSVSTSSKRTSRIHHSPLTSVLALGKAQVPQPITQFVTSPPSRLKLCKEGERKSDKSSRSALNRIISAHPPSSPVPSSSSSIRKLTNTSFSSSFDPGTHEPTYSIQPNLSPSISQGSARSPTQELHPTTEKSSKRPSGSQLRRSSMAKRSTWLPTWSAGTTQPTSPPNEHDNASSGSQIPSSSSCNKISDVLDSPSGQGIDLDSTPVQNPNNGLSNAEESITHSPPVPARSSTWFGFSNKVSDEPAPLQSDDLPVSSPHSTTIKHPQDGSHDPPVESTYPPAPTSQPQQPYLSRWYPSILASAPATYDASTSIESSTRKLSGDPIDKKSPSTTSLHTVPPDESPSTPQINTPSLHETDASKAAVELSSKSSRSSWWGWNNPSGSGFPLPTPSETHSVTVSEEPSVTDPSSFDTPEIQTTPTINNSDNQTYTSRVGSWMYSWYDSQSSNNQNRSDQPRSASHDHLEESPSETTPNLRTSNLSDLIPNPVSESIPTNSRGWAGMFSTRRVIPARDIDEEQKSVETMEIGSSGSSFEDLNAIDSTRVSEPVASSLLARIPSLRRKEPVGPNLNNGSAKHIKMTTDTDLMRTDTTIQPSSSFTSRYWRTSTPQTQAQQSPLDPTSDNESEPPKSEIHRPLTDSTLPPPKISIINGKARATVPNLILPTFEDTFMHPPRSFLPKPITNNKLKKTIDLVQAYVFSVPPTLNDSTKLQSDQEIKDQMIQEVFQKNKHISTRLPKSLKTLGISAHERLKGIKKISVIGIHGWFPGPWLETLIGKPTGTSEKFSTTMGNSLRDYIEKEMNGSLNQEFITLIPLEGDGKIDKRVDNLYNELYKRQDWVNALHESDAIFVVAHSQGSIVSCKLIERLIKMDGILGEKVMLLCMCGIWSGPFMGLNNSYTFQPVLKLLEGPAAHELFEFQDPRSRASRSVLASMNFCLSSGIKILLVGSLNDQVVPLYSALFNSISHPSILRSIFIDSEVYRSTDFLTNLITFCQRLKNSGLSDHGLQNHLSESLVGSLSGVGHSSVYEDKDVYDLAIRYFFETSSPLESPTYLSEDSIEKNSSRNQIKRLPSSLFEIDLSFSPKEKPNQYLLTWSLRGLIDDRLILKLFEKDLKKLRIEFEDWKPISKGLKDLKMRLEPLKFYGDRERYGNQYRGGSNVIGFKSKL